MTNLLRDTNCICDESGNLILNVTVQPRASRDKIVGLFDNTLKIATTAPPVDGKANAKIIALLSKLFKIPKSAISLKSGKQSRKKRFILYGTSIEQAEEMFSLAFSDR